MQTANTKREREREREREGVQNGSLAGGFKRAMKRNETNVQVVCLFSAAPFLRSSLACSFFLSRVLFFLSCHVSELVVHACRLLVFGVVWSRVTEGKEKGNFRLAERESRGGEESSGGPKRSFQH
mmetsp:Transcript_50813/g.99929  ORF Transcript_50813/g.99929 Transcript_50813/m.99929 type:complete len:125 (+) Transcript_50813:653-1027(+)